MVKTYPAVLLMAAQGRRIALAAGVVIALAAIIWVGTGGGLLQGGAGLIIALVVWAGLRLAAEVVEVVAETLLPR